MKSEHVTQIGSNVGGTVSTISEILQDKRGEANVPGLLLPVSLYLL